MFSEWGRKFKDPEASSSLPFLSTCYVSACARSLSNPSQAGTISGHISKSFASLVAQMVKRLSAMRETWARSLSREDPLEKEMATHSSTLAWKIPWMEEPGGPWSLGP